MSTLQFLAILIPAILGSGGLTAWLMRPKTQAEAGKANAETAQLKFKTILDVDAAQIQHVNGFTEKVIALLERSEKQSAELERAQSEISRLLRELEKERDEKKRLEAVNEYQRSEIGALRDELVKMAERSNERQREIDDLKGELEAMREQVDRCLRNHQNER